jgi:hypothetical protein
MAEETRCRPARFRDVEDVVEDGTTGLEISIRERE